VGDGLIPTGGPRTLLPFMALPVPFRPAVPGAKIALVVDDDPTVRTLVATTLSTIFTVYIADAAQRAMQLLLEIPSPSLVVCDIAMPGVDGIQFVKNLRAIPKLAATPVIFLTAKTMPMDVVAGINAGARFYLTKPFNPSELVEKARKATGMASTGPAR
jgi:DNA-binding response OmpR family regulator